MTSSLESAIVRIHSSNDVVVGAGFLVADRYILTCVHLVANVLGVPHDTLDPPQAELILDFPLLSIGQSVKARVIHWYPTADVAGLELIDARPIGAKPLGLVTADELWGHSFRTFGFPAEHDNGVWVSGVIRGPQADGWLQIEDVKQTGYSIQPGFSGAPVWDEQLNGVIGMVVAADRKPEVKTAFIIPAKLLTRVWPLLSEEHHSALTTSHTLLDAAHLSALISNPDVPDPVFLLGAGASQRSGIPLTGALLERAAKWAYCHLHQHNLEDPNVRRSDWLPWLRQQAWYKAQLPLEAQYVTAIRHLLWSAEDRRNFFRQLSRPPIEPSPGYDQLLQLMAVHRVRTVLTTNFDAVLPALADTVPNPRSLTVICSVGDYRLLSTAPVLPQLIYLHGDAEQYADRYFAEGYEHLDDKLVERLIPLLRDHPLIVIGYGGHEPAIVQHLLLKNAERVDHYQHGLYWCIPAGNELDQVDPLVHQLAKAIGPNFHFVMINSFDGLMDNLLKAATQTPLTPLVITTKQPTVPVPFDMQLMATSTLDDLDWSELPSRLLTYCRQLAIPIPDPVPHEWLIERMQVDGLARIDGDTIRPTSAGCLLFGKNPTELLPGARIEVHISGEEPTIFSGNLWQQLQVIDLLELEFNTPFRLKGTISETVTPYPSLALKEVVVNALAHRLYDGDPTKAVIIRVEPDHIIITNPGSLSEAARRQLPPKTPPEDALGIQPIKGYRNPVIADFLYSSGQMDKKGSGLVNVREWMRQSGGAVYFRVGPDDTFFEVTLYRRPEQPDDLTGTASALTLIGEFISNVLEIVSFPGTVWSAATEHRWVPKIRREGQGQLLPAFILYDEQLYTFSNLSNLTNPLRRFVEETTVQSMSLAEFAAGAVGERRLVNLFNEALRNFIENKGLIFDWKYKRAYFRRTEEGERTITYQARLRQATRTVVKARVSTATNQVVYWEHQAIAFQFKQFGESWGLQLLPTYVFTFDGSFAKLPGERSGPLTTRRLSREYNIHVDNHLVFWTTILSEGEPHILLEDVFDSHIILRSTPASCILRNLELQPEGEQPLWLTDEELDELEEQLSDLIAEDEDITDDAPSH
ncbi:MAG: hypothetical protein DPW09_15650 [Anaerolineae bacterium]|nr:hypothetical protein [Anaerolineae bacterium]